MCHLWSQMKPTACHPAVLQKRTVICDPVICPVLTCSRTIQPEDKCCPICDGETDYLVLEMFLQEIYSPKFGFRAILFFGCHPKACCAAVTKKLKLMEFLCFHFRHVKRERSPRTWKSQREEMNTLRVMFYLSFIVCFHSAWLSYISFIECVQID